MLSPGRFLYSPQKVNKAERAIIDESLILKVRAQLPFLFHLTSQSSLITFRNCQEKFPSRFYRIRGRGKGLIFFDPFFFLCFLVNGESHLPA